MRERTSSSFPSSPSRGIRPRICSCGPGFIKAARASLEEIAAASEGITALVGCPLFDRDLANACAVLSDGVLRGVYRKHFLPNYGVFDEHRYFAAGRELLMLRCGDVLAGPTICEDIWQPGPPATDLALGGAQLIVNLSASPFHVGKAEDREEMLVTRARDNASYLAFCNLVGGQDELVFDGHSVVLDDEGEVIARAPGFEECLLVVDLDPAEAIGRRLRDVRRRELERSRESVPPATVIELPPSPERDPIGPLVVPFEPELEQMRLALGLGLRDYVQKTGFREVVLGISGGIDSALTAAICADALGTDRVHTVSMPSRYSSEGTRDDAREVSENLGVDFREIPIESIVEAFGEALAALVRGPRARSHRGEPPGTRAWHAADGALEQVRLARGLDREQVRDGGRLRDALRRHGRRLRAAEGRLQDGRLPAQPAPQRRAGREVIPVTTIERPPSAELRAEQRDDQSLPPYELLDPVLEAYVELDRSREELLAEFDAATVERVLALVDRAEYKRRQAPPGVKLRPRAFGRDWRLPIAKRWQG